MAVSIGTFCSLSTVFCKDSAHLRASAMSSAVKKGRSCVQRGHGAEKHKTCRDPGAATQALSSLLKRRLTG